MRGYDPFRSFSLKSNKYDHREMSMEGNKRDTGTKYQHQLGCNTLYKSTAVKGIYFFRCIVF